MSDNVQYTISLNDVFSKQLETANNNALGFERNITKIGIAIAGAFAVDKVKGFIMNMVQAGSKVEDARTGLTTLLGSASEAQSVITNAMTDASKTPFAFEGLLAANKALISADVNAKDARATILDLSNAIAATGGGDTELERMVINMQQIKNTGKATALDIKQFAYAGINIYKVLADATNQPIAKVKDMEVSYDMLTMALKKAHDQGGMYANGLENMAGNTSVQISNLGDAMFQLSVKMFEDLKPAITYVVSGMMSMINAAKDVWGWMVEHKTIVKAVGEGLLVVGGIWVAYEGYVFAASIATKGAAIATGLMTAAQWLLNVAMNANPIGLVITALAFMTVGVIKAVGGIDKFKATLMGAWEVVKEFGRIVADVFMGTWEIIKGTFTFDGDLIEHGMGRQAEAMFNAGKRMSNAYQSGFYGSLKDSDYKTDGGVLTQPADTVVSKKKTAVLGQNLKASGSSGSGKNSSIGNAQGPKVVTYNIQIGKLIEEFNITTNNLSEGAAQIKRHVASALVSATNEFQLVSAGS